MLEFFEAGATDEKLVIIRECDGRDDSISVLSRLAVSAYIRVKVVVVCSRVSLCTRTKLSLTTKKLTNII